MSPNKKNSSDLLSEDFLIHSAKHFRVYLNPSQFLKYEMLICPIQPKKNYFTLTKEENSDLSQTIQLITGSLKDFFPGFTIFIRDYNETFFCHLVPRITNDLSDNNFIYKDGNLRLGNKELMNEELQERITFLKNKI